MADYPVAPSYQPPAPPQSYSNSLSIPSVTTQTSITTNSPGDSLIFQECNAGLGTIVSTITATVTAVGPTTTNTHCSGPTPNQGAITALGIVCGLLLLALLLLLVIVIAMKRKKQEPDNEKTNAYLDIMPGKAHAGAHNRRHTRTEYSSSGGHDDLTDTTARRHRRRHSHAGGIGLQDPRLRSTFYPAQANSGQPYVYAPGGVGEQGGGAGIPQPYYQAARPVNQVPGHGQHQDRGEEGTEVFSDGSTTNHDDATQIPMRQPSGRRRHSKMSSAESRGRAGRKE